MRPQPPEWLRPDEKREWWRLWKQSFGLAPRMKPEDRMRGVMTAFPLRLTVTAVDQQLRG